jgi:hypothetical protein
MPCAYPWYTINAQSQETTNLRVVDEYHWHLVYLVRYKPSKRQCEQTSVCLRLCVPLMLASKITAPFRVNFELDLALIVRSHGEY